MRLGVADAVIKPLCGPRFKLSPEKISKPTPTFDGDTDVVTLEHDDADLDGATAAAAEIPRSHEHASTKAR